MRRARYRGTHPRRFAEKYKELNPEHYAAEVQKVAQRGQTPAGMHRPICVAEILEVLNPRPGETGLDATVGYGGHARALLEHMAGGGLLLAVDADPLELPRTEARLRALGFGPDVLRCRRSNFAAIAQLLADAPQGFDFILADLGVSSMQLDNPARGFTFKEAGPLDLRFNPQRGLSAAHLIAAASAAQLEQILRDNADEPFAAEIAHGLEQARGQVLTTAHLAALVAAALAGTRRHLAAADIQKSVVRTFQALRIAVNDEFAVLELFLKQLPDCLRSGGRVAILSFHSGEDRRVKHAFRQGARAGVYAQIAADPIRPSRQEYVANPRSSSAKLRWAIRS
jgi:16S rRNA (cytosine1402-N4)-methyltransferase